MRVTSDSCSQTKLEQVIQELKLKKSSLMSLCFNLNRCMLVDILIYIYTNNAYIRVIIFIVELFSHLKMNTGVPAYFTIKQISISATPFFPLIFFTKSKQQTVVKRKLASGFNKITQECGNPL